MLIYVFLIYLVISFIINFVGKYLKEENISFDEFIKEIKLNINDAFSGHQVDEVKLENQKQFINRKKEIIKQEKKVLQHSELEASLRLERKPLYKKPLSNYSLVNDDLDVTDEKSDNKPIDNSKIKKELVKAVIYSELMERKKL